MAKRAIGRIELRASLGRYRIGRRPQPKKRASAVRTRVWLLCPLNSVAVGIDGLTIAADDSDRYQESRRQNGFRHNGSKTTEWVCRSLATAIMRPVLPV